MASNGHRGEKQRVLIAGGGVAGVEAALALRDLAADWVEVSLRDPRREFVFRPFAVGEPYGAARDLSLRPASGSPSAAAPPFTPTASSRSTPSARSPSPATATGCPTTTSSWRAGCGCSGRCPGAVTFWGVADEGQVGEVIARPARRRAAAPGLHDARRAQLGAAALRAGAARRDHAGQGRCRAQLRSPWSPQRMPRWSSSAAAPASRWVALLEERGDRGPRRRSPGSLRGRAPARSLRVRRSRPTR